MFFPFLTARRKSSTARLTVRLRLEPLEDRTLLNSRFVVPIASADNVINFATLQAALTTPGLNPGDVIQIEPRSAPGDIRNADLPAVAGLTVRGDPTAVLSTIPQFTVSDLFTVGAAQEGFTFLHVNIGLIQTSDDLVPNGPPGGGLVFTSDGTIAGSAVVDLSSAFNPASGRHLAAVVEFDGAADLLTDSTLASSPAASGVRSLLTVGAADGSRTVVRDNVFDMANVNTFVTGAVTYQSNGIAFQSVIVTDQLIRNTFINSGGAIGVSANVAIQDAGALVGLTIQDNTISDAASNITAVELLNSEFGIFASQNTQVIGNVINLTGSGETGILVGTGDNSASDFIVGNQVSAGSAGTGLSLRRGAGSNLNAVVQGNDFHDNGIGVLIDGQNVSAPFGVDLGGGKGSLGGNDFRGFTAPATANTGAIVLSNLSPSQGTITAQMNSFAAGVNPGSVIWDNADSPALASVDASNNLTGNAAFVAALYADLLKRAGDTSNPNDAGGLIAALDSGALTQAAAASALVHSPEALGVQVDGLYLKLLGRPSDAGGRAGFVSFMQNGGSLEQVVALMVSSPEYAALTGSDTGFVQSLYANLLGRTASDAEVAGYLAALPSQGRAGVALDFLRSAEFRTDVVDQFYNTTPTPTSAAALFPPLLHRPALATAAEVNGYVASGLSLLDLETAFISSTEFFVDG